MSTQRFDNKMTRLETSNIHTYTHAYISMSMCLCERETEKERWKDQERVRERLIENRRNMKQRISKTDLSARNLMTHLKTF